MIEPDESMTDSQLYGVATSGSREAVELLVSRYHEDLVRYILAKSRDLATANDAAGEAWLKFFEHLASARDDPAKQLRKPESLRFWLYKTALNAMRSEFRNQTRRRDLLGRVTIEKEVTGATVVEADQTSRLEQGELRTQVVLAYGRLGESCRELLAMMVAEPPLSYQEIAQLTNRPIGSLGPSRQRCLEQLRRRIGVRL